MEKDNQIPLKCIGSGKIWRWQVGPFQSRNDFKSRLESFLAARKFIRKMLGSSKIVEDKRNKK